MAALYWPFDTSTVSEWCGGYSNVRDGVHMGTDFAVPQGTELKATTDGTIRIYLDNGGGNGIDITNSDGLVVRNWHLSKFNVKNGDYVTAGQIIGLTGGAKGTWGAGNSTGAHLHWEIRTNNNFSQVGWLDPRPLNPKTFGQVEIVKDKEEMYVIRNVDSGHVYTVGKQYIRHEPVMAGAEYVARVVSADDKIIQAVTNEFNAVLDSFSIPRDKAQSVIGGKYWSRELDILNAVAGKK